MLKQPVTYEDFEGLTRTDDFYFNLSRTELMEHMDELTPRLEKLQEAFSEEPRSLTTEEVAELLSLVKRLIELSYGERSSDGRKFHKSPIIFEDFKASAAYDAFVWSLFENPEKAVSFMTGILPKQLLDQAQQLQANPAAQVESGEDEAPSKVDDRPAYVRENREPTNKELQMMSRSELLRAMQWKSDLLNRNTFEEERRHLSLEGKD